MVSVTEVKKREIHRGIRREPTRLVVAGRLRGIAAASRKTRRKAFARVQGHCGLDDPVLPKQRQQPLAVETLLVGYHLDDARQVGEEVSLVAVCEHGGHGGVVELDVGVVDLYEVDGGEAGDEGDEGAFYLCGDGALSLFVSTMSLFLLTGQGEKKGEWKRTSSS